MEEFIRSVAIVVFTDGKDVVVQERGAVSKVGEKYGFWGGGIEIGETPEVAIKREIKEEMGFDLENFSYLGSFPYEVKEECSWKGKKINQEVFIAPISEIPENVKIFEGKGLIKMPIEEVEKGIDFPIGSVYFVKQIKMTMKLDRIYGQVKKDKKEGKATILKNKKEIDNFMKSIR